MAKVFCLFAPCCAQANVERFFFSITAALVERDITRQIASGMASKTTVIFIYAIAETMSPLRNAFACKKNSKKIDEK